MFKYKAPCDNCPFRRSKARSFRLGEERVREIFNAEAFECHKTVYSRASPQQCVGLIALQGSEGQYNTITQVAMRLIGYNPSGIDTSDTFTSLAEAVQAHSE